METKKVTTRHNFCIVVVTNMKHNELKKQLSAYLDGELNPHEAQQVEAHMRTCRECASVFTDFRENGQLFMAARQPAPAGIWQAVQGQIASNQRRRHPLLSLAEVIHGRLFRPVAAGVGALALLTLVLSLVYLNPAPETAEDPLDFYLMAHTGYTTHNPVRPQSVDPFAVVETSETGDTDTSDSEDLLNSYLGVYFGE